MSKTFYAVRTQINGHLLGVIIETLRYMLLYSMYFHTKILKRRELRRFQESRN